MCVCVCVIQKCHLWTKHYDVVSLYLIKHQTISGGTLAESLQEAHYWLNIRQTQFECKLVIECSHFSGFCNFIIACFIISIDTNK